MLVSPTAPTTAFKLGEKLDDPLAMYLNDLATIPANLAGVPGISVPSGLADEDGLPAGVQILAPALADDRVYRVGAALEALLRDEWGGPLLDQARRSGRSRMTAMTDDPAVLRGGARERSTRRSGLEVHVELNTASKMFCGCPTEFGAEPNTQVCPTCLGLPGAMPVVNGKAVESAIRIGLALNCEIAEWCRFARKNYFYPDMPKNFQTSQYDEPIAFDGWTDVEVDGDDRTAIEIERAHMEEDTGKSLHVGGATGRIHGADYSLVDYNRAGIPLIEIVTKPITGTGAKAPLVAKAYVAQLRDLLARARRLRRADGAGLAALRRQPVAGADGLRRARHPHRDQERQLAALGRAGGPLRDAAARRRPRRRAASILQETRHWHEDTGVTTSGREKSDAEDYRYFPEPDLVPVAPSREWVEELRGDAARERRARSGPGCRPSGASPTSRCATPSAPARSAWSRRPSPPAPPPQAARKWWLSELARRANDAGRRPRRRSASRPRRWPRCRRSSTPARSTTSSPARSSTGCSPARARPTRSSPPAGWPIVSDDGALRRAVDNAIAANPDVADKIRDGKVAAAGALIGAVMKEMRGQADAGRVRELILEKLDPES